MKQVNQFNPRLLNKGLTLVELVVALGILVFVLAGLLLLFFNCIWLSEGNRQLSRALSHAQFILEDIQAQTNTTKIISGINSGKWNLTEKDLLAEPYKLEPLPGELIQTTLFSLIAEPLSISVHVKWNARGGIQRGVELRALKTNLR